MRKLELDSDTISRLKQSLIEIASESWRFQRTFVRAVQKLAADDRVKYLNQYAWFQKKVSAALDNAGLRIVDVEGQAYDAGMAIEVLNIEDVSFDESLIVEQVLTPIIMEGSMVVQIGTVILGRRSE